MNLFDKETIKILNAIKKLEYQALDAAMTGNEKEWEKRLKSIEKLFAEVNIELEQSHLFDYVTDWVGAYDLPLGVNGANCSVKMLYLPCHTVQYDEDSLVLTKDQRIEISNLCRKYELITDDGAAALLGNPLTLDQCSEPINRLKCAMAMLNVVLDGSNNFLDDYIASLVITHSENVSPIRTVVYPILLIDYDATGNILEDTLVSFMNGEQVEAFEMDLATLLPPLLLVSKPQFYSQVIKSDISDKAGLACNMLMSQAEIIDDSTYIELGLIDGLTACIALKNDDGYIDAHHISIASRDHFELIKHTIGECAPGVSNSQMKVKVLH